MLDNRKINQNEEFITKMLNDTCREGITDLIVWLKQRGFFTKPASINHHLSVAGGLAQHSINALYALNKLYEDALKQGAFKYSIPEQSRVISALLHDICKVDAYRLTEDGFDYKRENLTIGHGEKSLFYAARFIDLTDIEAMMIRWHMGPYDSGDFLKYQKGIDNYPEVVLMHLADNYATHFIDVKDKEE